MTNYNMTDIDSARNVFDIALSIASISNDMLGIFVLLLLAIVSFFGLQSRTSYLNAMPISGFFTSIVAIGLWGFALIDVTILLYPIIYLLIGIFLRVFFWDD